MNSGGPRLERAASGRACVAGDAAPHLGGIGVP